MASSFTPPPPSRCTYQVFLSFSGEATYKGFTDHLYTALLGAGFRTFRDDDGIESGEYVKSELDEAIKESRSSIIVFSKDYVSSRWCLDELVMILEHKKTSRHVILPVFYDVDPSEVRNQTGSFAEAFGRHEEQFMGETNERKKEYLRKHVEGWRAALREVADLAGIVLQNQADGHESKFIQKIVKAIGDKLSRTVLYVAPYLIGIGSRVKNINLWLQDESTNVGIAVIYGMEGIGKTTIAKLVYNLNFESFEASSLLANIREILERSNGLICLQRQLLSDILKEKNEKISSIDDGIIKIKDAIRCKRVLVVLDDVDQRDQLDAIIGMCNWFHPGSKIILTTRHMQLLRANEVCKMYKVERFDDDESFELFSWHAFGQDHPIEGYIEHSKRVVQHCGGLPLALQVLGSSLSGKSIDIWENALEKLAAIPDSQILRKLQISYDSLQDDHDKNLFLHISCFFIGKSKDFTVRILDECDFYPTVGIQNLIDRCLLTINEQNKLMMHQLLRDMGREIVRQESPKELGKHSRLWHNNDSFNVLRDKTGTETIEGLFLDLHALEEGKYSEASFNVNNRKRPRFEELRDESQLVDQGNSLKQSGFFSWNPINTVVRYSNQVELKTDAFARMHKLRLLQLNSVKMKGGYEDFPKRLRSLCWRGFPLKSIPIDFSLDSQIDLDLRNSRLQQVWEGTKSLRLLNILNLSHSHSLIKTPNFARLSNLVELVLKNCIHLVEVDESIGQLSKLVFLNLEGCKNLKNLPSQISHLSSLEKLILTNCPKLDQFPAALGNMKSLRMLPPGGTATNIISTTTSDDKSWSSLWSRVLKPRRSTEFIYFSLASLPNSLVSLSLSNCNLSNNVLALGSIPLLQNLNLSENPISSLPESIKGLTRLQALELAYCERLQSLPELPMSLDLLDVCGCRSLEMVTNLPNMFTHLDLDMRYCEKLVEVQRMFKLEPIGNVDAEIIKDLGLAAFESIGSLEVNLVNKMADTIKKYPLQVLYECGIYNIYLPWNWVPSWCNNRRRGSKISFIVPSHANLKIRAFKVYVLFAFSDRYRSANWDDYDIKRIKDTPSLFHSIVINNETKDENWDYRPAFNGIPTNKYMVWLSHWKIGHQLMEGGDKVTLRAYFSVGDGIRAEEVGVDVLYDEHEVEGSQHDNTYPFHHNVIDVDLSVHRWTPHSYFISHYHEYPYQGYNKKCTRDASLVGMEKEEPKGKVAFDTHSKVNSLECLESNEEHSEEWGTREINLMNNKLYELPESPNCPFLVKLFLQGNYDLMVIPPLFFEHMPVLQVLDLSYTSIKSLPPSISTLVALREFFLRGCDLLMKLPPEIGALANLEVFDLEGTEIMYLPKEIGELVSLKSLKVSFNGYANLYKGNKDVNTIIPRMALSNLSQLNELSIDVHPNGDWWDVEVRAIINELGSLRKLRILKLYMPVVELLKDLRWGSTSLIYPALTHFRFIVGHHEQRFISRLSHEVEDEFNKLEKGLKYINGEGLPTEITKVLKHADAFFLERHWTVKNLSEFGIENMDKLKFCLLTECNEFQSIIDIEQFYQEVCDSDSDESEHNSDFNEEIVLGSLQYLSIHYMKNMESICKARVQRGCLSNLKYLALQTCPSLITVFTLGMLGNLINLKELIVEDCPKINSLISMKSSSLKLGYFLPSLEKISLLELPELISISSGLCIAPKLERLVVFYCPKLERLSTEEVSSTNMKVIKGENQWWDSLKWNESLLSRDHQDYLAGIFVPLRKDGDLMDQLAKD